MVVSLVYGLQLPTSLPCQPSSLKLVYSNTHSNFRGRRKRIGKKTQGFMVKANNNSNSNEEFFNENPTKLITFLGKGGSGKTTAAVFAAQHYAKAGIKTCLVTHSTDFTAEYLLNYKIGTMPDICSENLSAVKLETTKMLLDPLKMLRKADARINVTQGALEGIVGEELGVLPGMDSIFSVLELEKFTGTFGIKALRTDFKSKYDVVIYDGISTEDTLRMISAANSARLYVKHLRSIAEKTDFGRLVGPSVLRLIDEAIHSNGSSFTFDGKLSSEIWDSFERILKRGASTFTNPQRFGCYILTDPCSPISIKTALRYWGCTIQAGASVSGALSPANQQLSAESLESVKENFSPLPFAIIPNLSKHSSFDWDVIVSHSESKGARDILYLPNEKPSNSLSSVKFDPLKRCITLFMPGFEKSEIKLYQFRGGTELLVEAGDQRRVIELPRGIQGKVGGAKFVDRSLVISMR